MFRPARIRTPVMLLCALLVASATVFADAAADLRLRSLAATCAACHGTDGDAQRGEAMPRLAGLPRAYFIAQMRAFRDGARNGTVMPQIAKGFDEGQTEALAGYFEVRAALP